MRVRVRTGFTVHDLLLPHPVLFPLLCRLYQVPEAKSGTGNGERRSRTAEDGGCLN